MSSTTCRRLEAFAASCKIANANARVMPTSQIDSFLKNTRSLHNLFEDISASSTSTTRSKSKDLCAIVEQILKAKPELTRTSNFAEYVLAAMSSRDACVQQLCIRVLRIMDKSKVAEILHAATRLCAVEDTGTAEEAAEFIAIFACDDFAVFQDEHAARFVDSVGKFVSTCQKKPTESVKLVRGLTLLLKLCGSSPNMCVRFQKSDSALRCLSSCILNSAKDPLLSLTLIEALPSLFHHRRCTEPMLRWIKASGILSALQLWSQADHRGFEAMLRAPSLLTLGRVLSKDDSTSGDSSVVGTEEHRRFLSHLVDASCEKDDDVVVNAALTSTRAYARSHVRNVLSCDALTKSLFEISTERRGGSYSERKLAATAALHVVADVLESLLPTDDDATAAADDDDNTAALPVSSKSEDVDVPSKTSSGVIDIVNGVGGMAGLVRVVVEPSRGDGLAKRLAGCRVLLAASRMRSLLRQLLAIEAFTKWLLRTPLSTAEDLKLRETAQDFAVHLTQRGVARGYLQMACGEEYVTALTESLARVVRSGGVRGTRPTAGVSVHTGA